MSAGPRTQRPVQTGWVYIVTFNGIRIIEDVNMVKPGKPVEIRLTWRERWMPWKSYTDWVTMPWEPWVKVRWQPTWEPTAALVKMGRYQALVAHPAIVVKLRVQAELGQATADGTGAEFTLFEAIQKPEAWKPEPFKGSQTELLFRFRNLQQPKEFTGIVWTDS